MKKTSLLSFVVLCMLCTACQKDPDTDRLDNDYLVYTNYDSGTDFNTFETFYVIDSILIIDNNDKPVYWNNSNSQKIVDAYIAKLQSVGYIAVNDENNAAI